MIFRKAILIIHGFAGGTYDQEGLANFLELKRNYDVYQFTLPGHEKNLNKVKYNEWISAAEDNLQHLINSGYKKIYLIGHSMGGVIATYLATKYSQVKKLVLAAPAFQCKVIIDGDFNIYESLKIAPKVIKTYGASEVMGRFLKSGVGALKEFLELVKNYYDYPKQLKCPVMLIQGTSDDIVSEQSSKYVYDSALSNMKKLIYVDGLTHDVFRCNNKLYIYKTVLNFLEGKEKGGIYNI